ncbi:unnamed protein product [Leuciscus chuanchicus]
MDGKPKQPWSVEETNCLLALWSSTEIQNKLDGAVRTNPVFEKLQNEMSIAGYQRSVDQLINKIKKFKKDYWDQKKELGRSGNGGRQRRSPHFDVLDSILGDRPACQTTGALNSATALLEAMVNGEADNSNASELSVTGEEGVVDDDTELPPPPPDCNSLVPSASVSSRQARRALLGHAHSLQNAPIVGSVVCPDNMCPPPPCPQP